MVHVPSSLQTPAQSGPVPEFAEQQVQTALGVTSVRRCGAGSRHVVLLHGISSGADSWRDCAQQLGRWANVTAWDAPGYGQSEPLEQAAPLATHYGARLAALLDALHITRPLIVGHSLGALMAAGYAHRADQCAAGYVLISPALGYGTSPRAEAVRSKRLEALETLGVEGMARNLPARLLSGQATETQRRQVVVNALRLHADGYKQAVALLCGDDIHRYTPLKTLPVQVACGALDIVTPPEQSRDLAVALGAPFQLIENAGHAVYVEQPQAVASLIRSAGNLFAGQPS